MGNVLWVRQLLYGAIDGSIERLVQRVFDCGDFRYYGGPRLAIDLDTTGDGVFGDLISNQIDPFQDIIAIDHIAGGVFRFECEDQTDTKDQEKGDDEGILTLARLGIKEIGSHTLYLLFGLDYFISIGGKKGPSHYHDVGL